MSLRRYQRDRHLRGGKHMSTASTIRILRQMLQQNEIAMRVHVAKENERLDHLAAKFLGDGRLWWVLAITSGIGWALQVPPGTRINVPRNLSQIKGITG
jgi:hypothetical protein